MDVRAFLIGAGFLGIIIGLAANETLSALIAGFTLMFSRPFEIGDWIQVPLEDGTTTDGIVTDITLFSTRIETFSGKYVILPNDLVGSNTLVNYDRKGRLRLEIEVGIDYGADPYRAIDIAEQTMEKLQRGAERPTTGCRTDAFCGVVDFTRTQVLDRPAEQSPPVACDDRHHRRR